MRTPATSQTVKVCVNGTWYERLIDARTLLVRLIREDLNLTGTHIGCDTGNCGACTVLCDGQLIKSCMMLAVQANGADIRTVEGLAEESGPLSQLQQSFKEKHAVQCGYCTPGVLMNSYDMLQESLDLTDAEIRRGLKGNVCRCTGYMNIISAIQDAARKTKEEQTLVEKI
ncbi:(2Fe-2S)-binding protein [Alicyclobacillus sp. SO9]|uniref:(2Fe-2S)-binding protein n=1 Tax=Alicyclobacillus sp. SO9 TaxID=2665646 RepID=UPI0018E7383A|nr:(2Fe-2S)-binding protein [Alicyclobacillus sp. SO9]QQE80501.1 (2Fe-2S)-binding protein [Alicyclobacillus sp. SO9]